jgi:hypothetical protein
MIKHLPDQVVAVQPPFRQEVVNNSTEALAYGTIHCATSEMSTLLISKPG